MEAIRSLPVLVEELASRGSRNPTETVTPALLAGLKEASKDPALYKVGFERKNPIQVVLEVAVSGDILQRGAMARYVPAGAARAFPSLYESVRKNATEMNITLKLIASQIRSLASHFGVSFHGDETSVASVIVQDYGGYSAVDLMIFFERAKSGIYKEEFQHISARGINYDFLKSWLNQYDVEREESYREIHKQYGQPDGKIDPDLKSQIDKEFIRIDYEKRKSIESQAADIRREWESELYEVQVVRQWVAKIEVEEDHIDEKTGDVRKVKRTKEILCDETHSQRSHYTEYPVNVFKADGAERMLKRLIYEYATFQDREKMQELFDKVISSAWKKFNNDPEMIQPEIKAIISRINSLCKVMTIKTLLTEILKKTYPEALEEQIRKTIYDIYIKYRALYFDVYLPDCIENKYPALDEREMIWQHVLRDYVNTGFKNPVIEILE